MKIVPIRLILLLALLFPLAECFATPNDPPPPSTPPPPGLPIDGGILFLLVASLAYGLYKVYRYNFNKKASH
ncbi:MAG TPA: hypothetical protein VGB43_02025 [Flavobacterium sp.]